MPNSIKYTTSTESKALRKGNFYIAVGDDPKAPTSQNGYWVGYDVPPGGYVTYLNKASNGPSIYVSNNDSDLITLIKRISGQNFTTISQTLNWVSTQNDIMVVNKQYPTIVTDGLVFSLDAGYLPSYTGAGSTWYDMGTYSNNGTLTNGPTFNSNGFFDLDGVDDFISIGNVIDFTVGSYTISFLIKIDSSSTSFQTLIAKKGVAAANAGYAIYYNGNTKKLMWSNANGSLSQEYYTINEIPTDKWIHITKIRDVDSLTKGYFYVNGTLFNITSNPTGLNVSNSFDLTIHRSSNSNTYFFKGKTNNTNIYSRALTTNEILQNYHQSSIVTNGLVFAIDAGNLVSYENGTTTVYNLSAAQSGSLVNGVGYSQDKGGVWTLDGTDDYLSFGSILNYTSESFSFSYWLKLNSLSTNEPGQGPVIFYKGAFQSNGYYSQISTNGRVGFTTNQSGVRQSTSTAIGSVSANNWYHITITRSGSTCSIYINGVYSNDISGTHINPASSGSSFQIGLYASSLISTNGTIANFYSYNRALTSAEIIQNFRAQKSRFGI